MARTKSITSIDTEIATTEKALVKAQAHYDALAARLLELQQQKKEHETRQVMEAFYKSGKSMQELMTFLQV